MRLSCQQTAVDTYKETPLCARGATSVTNANGAPRAKRCTQPAHLRLLEQHHSEGPAQPTHPHNCAADRNTVWSDPPGPQ